MAGDNRPENVKNKSRFQSYTVLTEIPNPPEYLRDGAKEIFKELASELIKANQMQEVDIKPLSTLSANIDFYQELYNETVKKGWTCLNPNGIEYIAPWVKQMEVMDKRISTLSAYFGFTPYHRKKIGISTGMAMATKKDRAAKFLKMKRAK